MSDLNKETAATVVLEIDRCDNMLTDDQRASLETGKDAALTNAEVVVESTKIKRRGKAADATIEEGGTHENEHQTDQRKRPVKKDVEKSPKKQKTLKASETNGDCEVNGSTVKNYVKGAQQKKASSHEEHNSAGTKMDVDKSLPKFVKQGKTARDVPNKFAEIAAAKPQKRGKGNRVASKEKSGEAIADATAEDIEEVVAANALKRGIVIKAVSKEENDDAVENTPTDDIEIPKDDAVKMSTKRGRSARGISKEVNEGETKNRSDEVAGEIAENVLLKHGREARGVSKQDTAQQESKEMHDAAAGVKFKRGQVVRGSSKEENGDIMESIFEETVYSVKIASKRGGAKSVNLKTEKNTDKDEGNHKIKVNATEGIKRQRGGKANSKESETDNVTKNGSAASTTSKEKGGMRKGTSKEVAVNKKNLLNENSKTKKEDVTFPVIPKVKRGVQKKASEVVQIIDLHNNDKETKTVAKRNKGFQKAASKHASIDDNTIEEVGIPKEKGVFQKAANGTGSENPKEEVVKPAARGRKRQATVESNQTNEAESNDTKKGKKLVKEAAIEESDEASKNQWNFKISSWNVNGVRAWIEKNGLDFLEKEDPDVFCVQETKCSDAKLPEKLKSLEGYHCYWLSGEREGYSGVGLVSKMKPIDVQYGIGKKQHDAEGRVITAEYQKFFLVNTYVPNSGRGLTKLTYRQSWDDDFRSYLRKLDKQKPVVLCGDLNVAHKEIDLTNPKTNKKTAGFTQQERDGFSSLLAEDFVDTFRHLYPKQEGAYTFWSFLSNSRAKNIGWRLDYFVISKRFTSCLCDSTIQKDIMGSDHCPISLLLSI